MPAYEEGAGRGGLVGDEADGDFCDINGSILQDRWDGHDPGVAGRFPRGNWYDRTKVLLIGKSAVGVADTPLEAVGKGLSLARTSKRRAVEGKETVRQVLKADLDTAFLCCV